MKKYLGGIKKDSEDLPYFYHAPEMNAGQLSPEESAHACRVLRMAEGDRIRVTDGKGALYQAVITYISPQQVCYNITDTITPPKSDMPILRLAISPTKNIERIEWLLEKLTECGITNFDLVLTERCLRKKINIERLQRIVISAMKQSHGCLCPNITLYSSITELLTSELPPQRIIAYCAENIPKLDIYETYKRGEDSLILIGPEGDFTQLEIEQCLAANFRAVTLGARRLRTETAGLYAGLTHIFCNK